jgi:hypothetical protein
MSEARYFRVTLSEEQHRVVEQAIRDLRAGDEESEAENEALLKAFLETTEEVK